MTPDGLLTIIPPDELAALSEKQNLVIIKPSPIEIVTVMVQPFTSKSDLRPKCGDSDVIFVTAVPGKTSLELFEVSEASELEKLFEDELNCANSI